MTGLFDHERRDLEIAAGAMLLGGFALFAEDKLVQTIADVANAAPFRRMMTPNGHAMSVAMTNCGDVGWVTDKNGYRYDTKDPESGKKWPAMPPLFRELAIEAAARAGYGKFEPDACLINRYEVGAKLSLHQDKDERDFLSPIVSLSLGLPATFLFGGLKRNDAVRRILLIHGDVVVWGAGKRLAYHGIAPLKFGQHALLGSCRINLTFRKAL